MAGKASHGGVRLAPVTKAPRSEAGTALEGEATLTGIGNAPSSHAVSYTHLTLPTNREV